MRPDTLALMKSSFAAGLEVRGVERGFRAEKKKDICDLYIYDAIGVDPWSGEGVTAKWVAEQLDSFAGAKKLNVYVNSPGGQIFEGKAIYSQLARFPATKTVYVDGIAASAASFIAMAGDRIVTDANATWMIHEAMGGAYGFAKDLEDVASVLRMLTEDIAAVYVRRTGNSMEQVREWMSAESFMNAAQAKERKFTDEIANEAEPPVKKAAAVTDLQIFRAIEETEKVAKNAADMRREHLLAKLARQIPAASRGQTPGQPGTTNPKSK